MSEEDILDYEVDVNCRLYNNNRVLQHSDSITTITVSILGIRTQGWREIIKQYVLKTFHDRNGLLISWYSVMLRCGGRQEGRTDTVTGLSVAPACRLRGPPGPLLSPDPTVAGEWQWQNIRPAGSISTSQYHSSISPVTQDTSKVAKIIFNKTEYYTRKNEEINISISSHWQARRKWLE